MKINLSRKLKKLGSALLTTLVICSILCMFVMYYLSLIDQQNLLSVRSQGWNMAIAVTEAGVEDGIEQLNNNSTNLTADGYTQVGSSQVFYRSNTMPDGNSYVVTLYVTNSPMWVNGVLNKPMIIAKSYVQLPALAQNIASTLFASAGGGNVTAGPAVLSRAVQVTCAKANLYTTGLAAKNYIDLHGNGVYTDSYNSQDPNKSVNGKYNSSKYSGDHGDIACNGGVVNDYISVQNANIYGKVHTGPNVPVTVGPNGGVGAHSWQASNSGLEPGWVLQDANFSFPDTSTPAGAGSWPALPAGGWVVATGANVSTNGTNSATYPNPPPWSGVVTNIASNNNSGAYPGSQPGLTTNYNTTTVGSYPGAQPGLTTNSQPTSSLTYPAPGTYVGTVAGPRVVNNGPPSGRGTWWDYNVITGYSYTTYTYTWPNYSYAWNLYQTNTFYTTNYYAHILTDNGQYLAATGMSPGTNLVIGTNVSVNLPGGLTGSEYITYAEGHGTVLVAANTNGPWTPFNITQYPSLLVYAGGTSVGISGNNIVNPDGFPLNFTVFCAPSVTSFSVSGNGTFTGVLVAPNAALTLNGGGNNNQDFSGSIMCNTATLNGHFSFHYDEALMSPPNAGRYLATAWNEIKP